MSRLRSQFTLNALGTALIIGVFAAVPGCQSQPAGSGASVKSSSSVKDRPAGPAAPGTAPALAAPRDEAPASDEARRLSDQAQRDMEELSRLRTESKSPPITQTTTPPRTSKATEQKAPPEILWNAPADRQARSDQKLASSKPASSPDSSGSAPAASAPPATPALQNALAHAGDDAPAPGLAPGPPPAGQTKVDRLAGLIVDLSGELYREAAYSDKPLRELLVISATTMLNPESRAVVADPAAIPDLTDRQRELLVLLQAFFAELGRELDGAKDEQIIAAAVAKLDKALSRQPQLRLSNASLCWRVEGFSKFDPFSRNAFMAQTDQQVIVYVEIGDFVSQETSSGEWLTRLSQQLVIYNDSDGIPVWQEDWQPAVDRTKKKRTDFFLTQVITLPRALSVGKYQLKVRVRDEQSKAEAETSVEFELVADQKLAASMH